MNKIIYSLVAFAGILVMANCSPKTVKNTTTDNTRTDVETTEESTFAKKSVKEQMDIVSSITPTDDVFTDGQNIYQTNCGKCHELYKPETRNIASWMKVMKSMSKKANLTDEHYKLVSVYLNAKAKV
jgi:cytochrome c5